MFQAPAHIRYKYFSAPLSPDLKKKHGTNAVPVRVGDTVRVMRGDRKGFEGKIARVDRKKYRIFVDGVTREKVDGTAVQIPIHPSKVTITHLDLDDKWRREALKRKGMLSEKEMPRVAETAVEEKKEGIEEKPEAEKAAKKPRRKKKKEMPAETSQKKVKKTKAAETEKPKRKRTKKAKVEEGAE
jgi:large subunit ribosomal protein L24